MRKAHRPPDTEAPLATLYRRFYERAYRLAVFITCDRQAAEDAVQEVFLRLHTRLPLLEDPERLEGYALRSVRHAAYDHLRRREARDRVHGELDLVEGTERSEALAVDPARVSRALQALPPEQREVVYLRTYEALRFREIADRLRIPLGTAISRHRYALEKLKTQLEDVRD